MQGIGRDPSESPLAHQAHGWVAGAAVPAGTQRYRPKWLIALELLDELTGREEIAQWFDGLTLVPPWTGQVDASRRAGNGRITAPPVTAHRAGELDQAGKLMYKLGTRNRVEIAIWAYETKRLGR